LITYRAVAFAAFVLAVPSPARADDTQVCIDANEEAIRLRKDHHLIEARAATSKCAAASCPDDLRRICSDRAQKLNEAIPSIVFAVQDAAGHDLVGVNVTVDGSPAPGDPTVTALELDPGPHTFVFEAAGLRLERSFLVREGEQQRGEPITLAPPTPERAAVRAPLSVPLPSPPPTVDRTAGWVVGAAGATLIVVGSVAGVMAFGLHSDSNALCPGDQCTSSGVDKNNQALAAAWVSDFGIGLGLGAMGVAAYLLLRSGDSPPPAGTALRIIPFVQPQAGGVGLHSSW
jgi:hypothetical protein